MEHAADHIKPLITEKTKAIMAVHIYGLTVDIDAVLDIAREHDLLVIEDAAEIIGQAYEKTLWKLWRYQYLQFLPQQALTTGEEVWCCATVTIWLTDANQKFVLW